MLEILGFIFQSFWHWAGTAVLLAILGSSVAGVIASLRRVK